MEEEGCTYVPPLGWWEGEGLCGEGLSQDPESLPADTVDYETLTPPEEVEVEDLIERMDSKAVIVRRIARWRRSKTPRERRVWMCLSTHCRKPQDPHLCDRCRRLDRWLLLMLEPQRERRVANKAH